MITASYLQQFIRMVKFALKSFRPINQRFSFFEIELALLLGHIECLAQLTVFN